MKKQYIKVGLCAALLFSGVGFNSTGAHAINYKDEVLKLEPSLSTSDLDKSVAKIAKSEKKSKDAIYKTMYKELKADVEKGKKELKQDDDGKLHILGETSKGGKHITVKSKKYAKTGAFYYTPSETAHLDHGHVGLFYSKKTIVESVPKKGVRIISTKKRTVDKEGAVMKDVKVSTAKKKAAAEWAISRVGKDDYSYKDAVNNRHTSHYGKKNCSKLIWSAYKLKAKIDLDKDKGLAVYPRDIRDDKQTKKIVSL